jgi:hypothetical protein
MERTTRSLENMPLETGILPNCSSGGRGRFEIVEELVLKAVKNADEKVLTFDWFARAVVKGYDHRGFVGGDGRRAGCGLPRLLVRHCSSHTLLCCLVFGELCGREFAALDVACVDLRKVLPLLGQVVLRENGGHRADRHTGAAVDALDGIDVELRDFIEAGTAIIVGRALLGVDAIYGAGIDAGGVLHPDAGLGNDVRHRPPPSSTLCFGEGRFKRCSA